jgi:protoporphyrinogen oxidase
MKVGIIGGGAAGLAAGYELLQWGHKVEIFERAPFLGGQASTFDVGGQRLERGYHHLFMSDTSMIDLIHEVGLGDQLHWIESKVGVYALGQIWPFVTPMDLLRFRAIPLVDRVRLGLMTLYLQRLKDWHKLERQTATEWVRKWMGKNAYEAMLGPMLRGKFGQYYEHVSMAWLWNKFALRVGSRGKGLKDAQKEKLGYPMCSFGAVFDRVAEIITESGSNVHTSASVQRVIVEGGQAIGVEVKIGHNEPETRTYDAVLATVPSFIFPNLVPDLPEDYLQKLTNVNYLAAVLIVLILDRPLSSVYWLNIADRSIPFLGVIEHTNFIDPNYYGGRHIVYISNYLSKENSLYHLKKEELFQEYLPHLRKLNPDFDPAWVKEYYYHREEAAQPVVTVNYSHHIPDYHTPISRLYLANTTQIYPEDRGTNYSVRLGRKVAAMMVKELS